MYHIVYKTTNTLNGKYYYGVHSTTIVNDDYLGSGTNIRRAIKKYGREVFKREVLCVFDDRDSALYYEKTVVTPKILLDEDCYNIVEGGGMPPSRKGKVSPSTLLTGELRTEKQKLASKLHSEKMKGRIPHNKGKPSHGKAVKTPEGIFRTGTEAALHYGITSSTVTHRCRNNLFGFEYYYE